MTPAERLAEAVDALTQPRTHREPYTRRTEAGTLIHDRHVTRVASLLEQLGASVSPSGEVRLDSGHAVPGSRPTARLEAIDALMAIDVEASHLLAYTGGTDRGDIGANLRALVGRMSTLADDDQAEVARTAGRWVSRALSVTGWEVEPFRPDNTCPLCAEKRTLRVRVVTAYEVHASCVACGETWTPESIGLLAEHVRWENGEEAESA